MCRSQDGMAGSYANSQCTRTDKKMHIFCLSAICPGVLHTFFFFLFISPVQLNKPVAPQCLRSVSPRWAYWEWMVTNGKHWNQWNSCINVNVYGTQCALAAFFVRIAAVCKCNCLQNFRTNWMSVHKIKKQLEWKRQKTNMFFLCLFRSPQWKWICLNSKTNWPQVWMGRSSCQLYLNNIDRAQELPVCFSKF